MRPLLAVAPIATVLVAMVGLGWSAVRAGLVAATVALVLAAAEFDLGGPSAPYGRPAAVAGVGAEAAFVSLTVVAIIGPALAVHHLQQRTGSTAVLRAALERLSPDPRVAALLVAWFFSLFIEGAAGFGTPVALAAPFLVTAGFRPVAAITAALIGHAAGVSFGALGTPVFAQVAASGFTGRDLAAATAPYHALLGWVLAGALVVVIGRALPGQEPPWRWGALAAVTFLLPYWLVARFVGPELPTLAGALIGAALFVVVVRLTARSRGTDRDRGVLDEPDRPSEAEVAGLGEVWRAAAPYLALLGVVLVTRLVPPVSDALFGVVIEWHLFTDFTGSVRPLYHPGLLLPLAFAVGAWAQRASLSDVREAVGATNRRLVPVVAALVAMVAVARAMSHGGMTAELAEAAAGAGAGWPLLAPAIGALGTFVTGSATASNILFTEFQLETAVAVDRAPLPLLGAQGFGAAVGNVICPHNIVAAAATVGLSGREGTVLRRTLPVALAYVALGGVLALLL